MPIRVNLLAEAQIAEDLRRRDPVKRAIYAGAFLVVLALAWSSSLQLGVMMAKRDLGRLQGTIGQRTDEFQKVVASQKKVYEIRAKLESLKRLVGSRFLQGNFMNALQQLKFDDVQLMRVRVEQSFSKIGATPNKTNDTQVVLGHPAGVAEQIHFMVDARDSSANPGDQINKFKETVASNSYFKSNLDATNSVQLVSLSQTQTGTDAKPYVLFTVEWNFPPQNR
jgi:hypothetical protein